MKFSCKTWLNPILACLNVVALLYLAHSIPAKRELEVTYNHPEQYIVYNLKSTDTLVVGKVAGKYDKGSMYLVTIEGRDYLLTKEQYDNISVGDMVFTHVKEVE